MLGRVARWSVAQNSLFEFDCGKSQSSLSQPLERFSSTWAHRPTTHSPRATAVDKSQQFGPCMPMATAAAVTSVFAARRMVASPVHLLTP